MKKLFWVIFANLVLSGCAFVTKPEAEAVSRLPSAGIIRQVNRAEYYMIFESGQAIPPGTEIKIIRNGQEIGSARALNTREEKFQAADILEGAPQPGDLCEPKHSALRELLESQPGE